MIALGKGGQREVDDYSQWRRFEQAVERATTSCKQSGNDPNYHFAGAGKMVDQTRMRK
jgi:hypothetical protein